METKPKKDNSKKLNYRIFNKITPFADKANLSVASYIDHLVLDFELNKGKYDKYLELRIKIKDLIILSLEIEKELVQLKKECLEANI